MNKNPFRLSTPLPRLPQSKRFRIMASLMAVGATSLFALSSPTAQAQTYLDQTLYSFTSNSNDGNGAFGSLTSVGGMLYGTTNSGGAYSKGTVFSMNPVTHAETILYSFSGGEGALPQAGLVYDSATGKLYGTTSSGGSGYSGSVFAINLDGTGYQTLYSFSDTSSDGGRPEAGLIDVNGTLYGTTYAGGPDDEGTVFSINTQTHTETTLHCFRGSAGDGFEPFDNLVNVNGVLYGTTVKGGSSNTGTVFSLNLDGSGYQTVHSFQSSAGEGTYPVGGLTTVNNLLYGTTEAGGNKSGGTIFSLDPVSRQLTTVYQFTGGADGAAPYNTLINVNGILYGTTVAGGINSNGTVFSFNTGTGQESTLHQFASYANDGRVSRAGLTAVAGVLYGVTQYGGTSGAGTVYSLSLSIALPVASNDTYTTKLNTAYTASAPGVLGNDYNGGSSICTAALVSNVSHGTLTFNTDGSFTYTPAAGFAGTDSFTYQAVNPLGVSNTATVTLGVQVNAPVAKNDMYAPKYATAYAVKAPGVLGNDISGGSTSLTAALVSNVSHGTLTFNSDGSFVYTPAAGFAGTDSFTYQVTNGFGSSNTATVNLVIQSSVPVAHNDAYAVKHNTTFGVKAPGVLGNDYAGTSGTLTAALVTSTTHGTLTLGSDGSFVYIPAAGFSGTDSFSYQAVNSIGASSTATVTVIVQ